MEACRIFDDGHIQVLPPWRPCRSADHDATRPPPHPGPQQAETPRSGWPCGCSRAGWRLPRRPKSWTRSCGCRTRTSAGWPPPDGPGWPARSWRCSAACWPPQAWAGHGDRVCGGRRRRGGRTVPPAGRWSAAGGDPGRNHAAAARIHRLPGHLPTRGSGTVEGVVTVMLALVTGLALAAGVVLGEWLVSRLIP